MTTQSAARQSAASRPRTSVVTVDLPAIEAFAGRVDRLAATVSLTRSLIAGSVVSRLGADGHGAAGADEPTADPVLAYVDDLLHRVAVATREVAERLRDSRDAYAHAAGDSALAVSTVWITDDLESVCTEPPLPAPASLAAESPLDPAALSAECRAWAAALSDGLGALAEQWTDPAAGLCAAYVRRTIDFIKTAGQRLAVLPSPPDDRLAA